MSSHEVLEQLLARVERHNPALNAIVTLDAERARAQAKAADAALARGVEPGPLHGLPVTVKDAFETQELPEFRSSQARRGRSSPHRERD